MGLDVFKPFVLTFKADFVKESLTIDDWNVIARICALGEEYDNLEDCDERHRLLMQIHLGVREAHRDPKAGVSKGSLFGFLKFSKKLLAKQSQFREELLDSLDYAIAHELEVVKAIKTLRAVKAARENPNWHRLRTKIRAHREGSKPGLLTLDSHYATEKMYSHHFYPDVKKMWARQSAFDSYQAFADDFSQKKKNANRLKVWYMTPQQRALCVAGFHPVGANLRITTLEYPLGLSEHPRDKYCFVLSEDGVVYTTKKIQRPGRGRVQYSSFLEGKPVRSAGYFLFNGPHLREVFFSSGHYLPGQQAAEAMMDYMGELVADDVMDGIAFTGYF